MYLKVKFNQRFPGSFEIAQKSSGYHTYRKEGSTNVTTTLNSGLSGVETFWESPVASWRGTRRCATVVQVGHSDIDFDWENNFYA